jgi:hypothetical protein
VSLFKNVEIPAEVFALMMRVLKEYGLKDDVVYVGSIMCSLSKTSNFDMTLMFMDSKEKKDLIEIVQELKRNDKIDKDMIKILDQIYKL